MAHSKRISTGYGKNHKWVVTPKPGSHRKLDSIPLQIVIRDELGLADNAREAKKIIREGLVLINGVIRRTHNFSLGVMDVIQIPKIKKNFLVLPSKNGILVTETSDAGAKIKLRKIVGKKTVKGSKTQLMLSDGSTQIADKVKCGVGDTLVLETESGKTKKVLQFKEGNTALIVFGVYSGQVGKIAEKLPATSASKSLTKVGELTTLSEYVLVVGEEKPLIPL